VDKLLMSHYLITGSSSGIGAALATQLTANGHAVSGVARRKQRLTALANQLNSFNGYAADVGDTKKVSPTPFAKPRLNQAQLMSLF